MNEILLWAFVLEDSSVSYSETMYIKWPWMFLNLYCASMHCWMLFTGPEHGS